MFFAVVVVLILSTLSLAWLRHRNASGRPDLRHPHVPGNTLAEQDPWDGYGGVTPPLGSSYAENPRDRYVNAEPTRRRY